MASHQKGTINLNNSEGGYWFTVTTRDGRVTNRWTTITPWERFICPNSTKHRPKVVDGKDRGRIPECQHCKARMTLDDWYPHWEKIIDEDKERRLYLRSQAT